MTDISKPEIRIPKRKDLTKAGGGARVSTRPLSAKMKKERSRSNAFFERVEWENLARKKKRRYLASRKKEKRTLVAKVDSKSGR